MKKGRRPNPGSDKAIALGCTCAVLDNAHGKGYMGQKGVFVMSADCKLHEARLKKANENKADATVAEV